MIAPKNKISQILDAFNEQHNRLKFTIEYEEDHTLNFLDLSVINKDNKIIMDWYHKKTFWGRYLSYFSNHPICHKIGMVFSLVDRTFLLSNPIFFKKNIELIIMILKDNGYPIEFIFEYINKRITALSQKNSVLVKSNNEKEMRVLMVFPYVKSICNKISRSIDKSNNMIGYRCTNKLNRFIKVHKDRNPHEKNNNVIYRLNCNNCDVSYVGQTKRQLQTRIREHRNNIKLDQSKHSVISKHINDTNHDFNWEDVNILDFEKNYKKRNISEMIHIKEQINGLNLMKDIELLDKAYSNILDEICERKKSK
ncbi:hypothetical protein ALC57_13304 [Trachymyrmex cornetzi]|uniref:GIY-YIG domain-containing protein n=1 Tax=Trachymyrmex cornetzi TaxID=471704 RepID=A0A151IZV9_9HYME|nr:hypothetical protein ALC57_13304 [Trachymyrmex cornetzi]